VKIGNASTKSLERTYPATKNANCFVSFARQPCFLIDREGKLLGVFVGGGAALKKLISSVEKVVGG
jgi:hypothetical protein